MKKPSPKVNRAQINNQIDNQTGAQREAQLETQIDTILTQLWQKNLPTIRERLDLLDRFGSIAASGSLDEATRIEALNIAHKLAGSLGMYGYQQGTEVASKMERILKSPTPETLLTLATLAADLRNSLASAL
jgi:HPt (histidine-containing phosphotransfer) domain-containing protein